MFNLNEKYEVNKNFLNGEFIRYTASEINTINTATSQIHINIPRGDSVIFLLNSYLDIYSYVLHAATGSLYADSNDISIVNLGPITFLMVIS